MTYVKNHGGVIVNADSIQVYKYLNIGSAKPTAQEREEVPHFLYDIVEPDGLFTAGDYRRAALPVIDEQVKNGPVLIVGGSGFYIQALDKGMYDVEPVSPENMKLIESWVQEGVLWDRLVEKDPEAAQRIGAQDQYRLQRALEMVISKGKPVREIEQEFASAQQGLGARYHVQKIGIRCDREKLRRRVEIRTEKMLNLGLIEEVEGLIQRGFEHTKALSSVGYRECVAYLKGHLKKHELKALIVTSTMQLAKKQSTWFRRDPEIVWFES